MSDVIIYSISLAVGVVLASLAFWRAWKGDEATAAIIALIVTALLMLARC